MFARRNSIFATAGFSLGPALLSDEAWWFLRNLFSSARLICHKAESCVIVGFTCLISSLPLYDYIYTLYHRALSCV